MFDESLRRISDRLDDSAEVLDVGGWARPLNRADWVLDLMPYESRGMLGHDGPGEERFREDRWVTRDICAHEPWPFDDGFFDFAVCSHTLEDVRDPVWVCAELQRVARAGYIEVPSRLEEQSWNVQGPWVGWGHHHWLIDVDRAGLSFVFKPHLLGALPGSAFEPGFAQALPPTDRVSILLDTGKAHHSPGEPSETFETAPQGVVLDTPEQIRARAAAIEEQAVRTKAMPLGNLTRMTQEERERLGAWIDQGARIP